MFERFTDDARRIVVLAQEEARLLGHGHIGTEHLLLALLRQKESVAGAVLGGLGIDLDVARARVGEIVGTQEEEPGGHIPFTPRAKKVLELSLREALQLKDDYIGAEHLLLGLIAEGEGVGAQVLADAGADFDEVRRRIKRQDRPEPAVREGSITGGRARRISVVEDRLAAIEDRLDRIELRLDEASGHPDDKDDRGDSRSGDTGHSGDSRSGEEGEGA